MKTLFEVHIHPKTVSSEIVSSKNGFVQKISSNISCTNQQKNERNKKKEKQNIFRKDLCRKRGLTTLLALCSLFVITPKMLGILIGMDQKDSYAVQRSLAGRRHSIRDRVCVDTVVDFPVVQDVQISPSWRRGSFPWSKLFVGPKASPVAEHGGRCPCCAVSQVLQFSRADVERQPSSHSRSHARCVQRQVPGGSERRELRWSRSCSALTW